jgi:hypothetical protein
LLQIINIVTIGDGVKGGFFPNGLYGKINSAAGYMNSGNGFADFPTGVATQVQPRSSFFRRNLSGLSDLNTGR